jgi:hypothetical protein
MDHARARCAKLRSLIVDTGFPAGRSPSVRFAQRSDQSVATLLADLTVLIAMTTVSCAAVVSGEPATICAGSLEPHVSKVVVP